MKNKAKKTFIIILTLLLALIITANPSLSVFADSIELEGIDAQQLLRDISSMEAKMIIVRKCVPSHVKGHNASVNDEGAIPEGETAGNKDQVMLNGASIQVGPWLEEKMTGEAKDGKVYCGEDDSRAFINLITDAFDIGHASLLCNRYNHDKPGLITLVVKEHGKFYPESTDCGRFGENEGAYSTYYDKDELDFGGTLHMDPDNPYPDQIYENGYEYMIELFHEWARRENIKDYVDNWEDIYVIGPDDDDMLSPKYLNYYVARNDFIAMCGDEAVNSSEDGRNGVYAHQRITKEGIKWTEYLEDQHYVGDSDTLWGEQGATCENLTNRVNKYVGEWRKQMAKIFEAECNNNASRYWEFENNKASFISGSDKNSKEPRVITWQGNYPPGLLDQDMYNELNEKHLLWENFDKVTKEDGTEELVLKKFSVEEQKKAKDFMSEYNTHKGQYFKDLGENEGEGFTCLTPEGYTYKEVDPPTSDSDSDSDPEAGDSDPCYDAGVEGMSWVLCPAINNTSNTVDKIEELLRGWLTIPVDGKDGIYAQAKDSNGKEQEGTYVGWDIFRNIANVFLAILFLFIIFSQLTGYGIDNYGIKKMLPKLIAIAIIINLSYILCKIAVDVSNILGVGLNNLFETIGRGIASAGQKDMNYTTSTIVGVLFGAIAGTGAVAGIALSAAGGGWVMVVVVLLLALLVALVGILIFFVMLSVRIIIVAVFIVLAPLALACYILPNTKSLFQKWWKVFEAALLVFPICGALYGASFIVKAIVGGDGAAGSWTFMGAIAAVIAPFLPFFALPSLLKGALAGLGAIGGTLTALGGSLKKGAQSGSNAIQSGIKGTERYKNNMQERARSRQAKLTNRGIEKLENRQKKLAGKGKSLSAGEQQLLARRYQTKDKLENEDRAARTVVEQNRTSDMDLDGLMKEWNNAWNGGDSKKLDAMTSVINSRYGASGASQIANSLAGKDVASDEQAQSMMGILQNNMNHDSTFANNMRNKAADAYSMISDGGRVREKNGKFAYKNLDHFTKSQTAAEKDKDWATQSKDTIRRAIKEGKLGKEQIERMLYDTNPNIQSELNGDGKRGVLEEALKDMGGPSSTTPSSTSGGIITADSLEGRQEIERQRKKGRII